MKWDRIVDMVVVRQCYNNGATLKQLAEKTDKSISTIRRWLRITGLRA